MPCRHAMLEHQKCFWANKLVVLRSTSQSLGTGPVSYGSKASSPIHRQDTSSHRWPPLRRRAFVSTRMRQRLASFFTGPLASSSVRNCRSLFSVYQRGSWQLYTWHHIGLSHTQLWESASGLLTWRDHLIKTIDGEVSSRPLEQSTFLLSCLGFKIIQFLQYRTPKQTDKRANKQANKQANKPTNQTNKQTLCSWSSQPFKYQKLQATLQPKDASCHVPKQLLFAPPLRFPSCFLPKDFSIQLQEGF